jgi:hypothetical protein
MITKKTAILVVATLILFSNCSKKNSSPPPDTVLKMTVTDNLGNPVSGATVTLYLSQSSFLNQTNAITSNTTGTNGIAIFSGLSPVVYYWRVIKGCQTNFNGAITSSALTANITNNTIVVLQSVGNLKMVNNSSNPYKIYINGVLTVASFPGNSNQTFTDAPIGAYTIRVVQLSGFAVSPTDETFTGNLTCGLTLVTTFP